MQCQWDNGRQCPKKAVVMFASNDFEVKGYACNGHRIAMANKLGEGVNAMEKRVELPR